MAVATLPTLPDPFAWQGEQIAGELPGGRVLFSTRLGGVSDGPYASLNLGLLTDDAEQNVRANRDRLGAATGHPWERVCFGRQVHGARVRRATAPPDEVQEEDGQATARDDLAALVFVADCLPILLAAEGAVAALHGGWRPLASGIVA
jgi:polyphenol oxidase